MNYNEKVLEDLKNERETIWLNDSLESVAPFSDMAGKRFVHVKAAQTRLMRFMPYIEKVFPETAKRKGIIESDIYGIPEVEEWFRKRGVPEFGRIILKDDAHLPISGSVKARGGIYEVLKLAEGIAMKEGTLKNTDDYSVLDSKAYKDLFAKHTIHVGSTGNLGLSVGIMGSKLGFKVVVHMSKDAREWKKNKLRECGCKVMEYDADYTEAVRAGREEAGTDPFAHFIDDENSLDLFMGYATAALRVKVQLYTGKVPVTRENPLFVYIPCGVGGAPGGITYGLKQMYGDNVHCFFAEPVKAPCFTLGMCTGKKNGIGVTELGIKGNTKADGLAVLRPSKLVCDMMEPLVSGSMTVTDEHLLEYEKMLWDEDGIYVEPSAAAGFKGVEALLTSDVGSEYIEAHGLSEYMKNATHLVWATGGGMVPEGERWV